MSSRSPLCISHSSTLEVGANEQSTKANKQREAQTIAEFRDITGANVADSTRFVKKYKSLETVSSPSLRIDEEWAEQEGDADQ
jgi:hypothetical protein